MGAPIIRAPTTNNGVFMSQSNAQRTEEGDAPESAGKRPVYTAKHGNVEIPIWQNSGTKGEFYSASTPKISYKDDAGEWKEGTNFGRHDLLDLAEAAHEAATKIRDLSKAQSRGR